MNKSGDFAAIGAITRLVELSSRYAWLVILGFLLVATASASYFTGHFVITSDTNKLISSSLPWRQQEVMLDLAFPHRVDRIVAVIEATTPEAADSAADALGSELSPRSDVIRTISGRWRNSRAQWNPLPQPG
jgi:predicted RND superfamily exporter protein